MEIDKSIQTGSAERTQVVCSRDHDQQFFSFSITLYFAALPHTLPQEMTLLSFTSPAQSWDRWPSVSSMELNDLLLCVNHC